MVERRATAETGAHAEDGDEVLSPRLRELIEDILEGRAPNAGEFCGNCYHPLAQDAAVCPHCGRRKGEPSSVESIPMQVIDMHRRRRSREGLAVRSIAWGGLTIGVIVALLPFVFGDVTLLTVVLFFGLLIFFYIGSANVANSLGDSLGYRWGRSDFERRWHAFTRDRDEP